MTKKTFILASLFATVFILGQSSAGAQESPLISKKTVQKFIDWNRDTMLEYQCLNAEAHSCNVVCSSGGNNYINIQKVIKAYYSVRKSSFNGLVTGYYLVVDVVDDAENQDVWATLQTESSCLFKGMTPKL